MSGNHGGYGGGIYQGGGSVTLLNSTVASNDAVFGGGIYSIDSGSGSTTLVGSTVSGNWASFGGAVGLLGDLPSHQATVINSTISGNTASLGSGIWQIGYGTLTITNTTFSGNSVDALYNFTGTVTLTGSVLANSLGGQNCSGLTPPIDGGTNLDDDGSCPTIGAITNLDLGLRDNGGPTRTHALLFESSAIDAGGTCSVGTDQRGSLREAGSCDIGSFDLGMTVGGSVSGVGLSTASCFNLDNPPESSVQSLGGGAAWNCEGLGGGLLLSGGEIVLQRIKGRITALPLLVPIDLAGEVTGLKIQDVVCFNDTLGVTVTIPDARGTRWDCVEAGLPIALRHDVTVEITGLTLQSGRGL